jgi:hypothetical protein
VENQDLNIAKEQKKNPERLEVENIPGYLGSGTTSRGFGGFSRGGGGIPVNQVKVKWIVKGGSKYTVKVESVKGGTVSAQSQ